MKILFVDDDESIRFVAESCLKKMGFDIVIADGGIAAQEILEKQEFTLVITDLHMPKGGGQQLIEWCLQNKPETKLLAISGEDLDITLSALEIVEAKGIPTLEKPFEMTQLETIIRGMMSNQFL